MKKIIALLFCVIIAASLVSCVTVVDPTDKDPIDPSSIKTLGDYFALDKESDSWGYGEDNFIAVFKYGEKMYRVAANLTTDIYNKMEEIDFFDDKRDEKLQAILKDVEVSISEDMEKYIPTDTDLKAFEGKTGQQLLDDGFYETGYALWDEQYFYMSHGMIEYKIFFNEKITVVDGEDLDVEETIKNMTVKKAEFNDFTDSATDPETLPQN